MPINNKSYRTTIPFGIVVLEFFIVLIWSICSRQNINLNAALLLDCGQKIYNGSQPYVDFYEFNPPVIMYLSVIPVWFSNISGLNICLSFQIFVSICIALSTISLYFILMESWFNPEQALQVISAALLFHASTLYFYVFGEREHFMVMGLTPFLIIRCSVVNFNLNRNTIWLLWFAAGQIAGLVAHIKPHFLAIPALMEAFNLFFRKSSVTYRTPEIIGFCLSNLIYLGYWFVMPADTRHNYFGLLIPFALVGYDSYSSGFIGFISNFVPYHPSLAFLNITCVCIFVITVFQTIRFRDHEFAASNRFRTISMGMILSWIGSLLIFISQKKGWYYQMLPMNWFAMIGAASIPLNTDSQHSKSRFIALAKSRFIQISLISVLFSFVYIQFRDQLRDVTPDPTLKFVKFINGTTEGNGRVIVMASSVRAYPALLNAGRTAGSRFMDFFHLPSLYHDQKYSQSDGPDIYRSGPTNPSLENRFINELYSDIEKLQPTLIMINKTSGDMGLPRRFNIRDYYHYHGIEKVLKQNYELSDDYSTGIKGEPEFEVWKLKA